MHLDLVWNFHLESTLGLTTVSLLDSAFDLHFGFVFGFILDLPLGRVSKCAFGCDVGLHLNVCIRLVAKIR